ncbi:MAG: tyrosine-type recombinase/integrase [Candidatus Binataceae bacterium]
MRHALTAAFIDSIKPTDKRADYWDKKLPGFGLRVTENGVKTWTVMYRHARRLRRLTIGGYPAISLADARDVAKRALRDAQLGADPATDKQQAKDADSFWELAQLYLARHAKMNKRSWSEDERIIEHDLLPAWRNRKAAEITRRDVIGVLDGIVARDAAIMANRVRALISKIFNFAIGRDIVENNPAYRVPRPGQERQRERVLSDAEIKVLWRALDAEPSKIASAFRLALLTAQRKGEVLGMTWNEVDLDGGWWTIPAERAKNGLAHRVPLAPQTQAILRGLLVDRNGANDKGYAFPGGKRGSSLFNLQKPMRRIKQATGIDFKFHDLRRTAASLMTGIGIERLVVSKILNHVERSITAVYDRHSYDNEKRAALLKWDRRLAEIVTGESTGDLIEFPAQAQIRAQ